MDGFLSGKFPLFPEKLNPRQVFVCKTLFVKWLRVFFIQLSDDRLPRGRSVFPATAPE